MSAAFTAQFGAAPNSLTVGTVLTPLTSIAVAAGSYIVTAKVILNNSGGGQTGVQCVLTQRGPGLLLDRAQGWLASTTAADTLTLHAAAQVTAAGGDHLELFCQVDSNGAAFANYPQLTAIQVGTITAPGP